MAISAFPGLIPFECSNCQNCYQSYFVFTKMEAIAIITPNTDTIKVNSGPCRLIKPSSSRIIIIDGDNKNAFIKYRENINNNIDVIT